MKKSTINQLNSPTALPKLKDIGYITNKDTNMTKT